MYKICKYYLNTSKVCFDAVLIMVNQCKKYLRTFPVNMHV